MTHQQILDKLAAKSLVQNIDEDLARLTGTAMRYAKHDKEIAANLTNYILPKMILRWNCILEADSEEVTVNYKRKAYIALAVTLHKYGLTDKIINEKAIHAIDDLNKEVVLSDDFFRKTAEIKAFINSKATELKRIPSSPDNITFYRPKDVISIQLGKQYFCAYIHSHERPNESPILEFYDKIFDSIPKIEALEKIKAKGRMYDSGVTRVSKFSVAGIKFLPDLANQIKLIAACVETPPSNTHLDEPVGLYTITDIFGIQDDIDNLFK